MIMQYKDVKNLVWFNQEKTAISMEVIFPSISVNYISFLASKNDTELHGIELFERAKKGDFGKISPFSPPSIEEKNRILGLKIKDFCSNRINDVAKLTTQMNLLSALTNTSITTEEETSIREVLNWIKLTVETSRNLITEKDVNFEDVQKWPIITGSIIDTCSKY